MTEKDKEIKVVHFHFGFTDENHWKVLLPTSNLFMSRFSGKGQYIFVENQSTHTIIKISGSFNDDYQLDFVIADHNLYQAPVIVSEIDNLDRINKYEIEIEYKIVNDARQYKAYFIGKIVLDA